MKCLLRPSRIGQHPEVFSCSHTGHMSAHMTHWHFPALVKLKELNGEGLLSRQEIINRIFSTYGVKSSGVLLSDKSFAFLLVIFFVLFFCFMLNVSHIFFIRVTVNC